jgi:hypothetical protein
MKHWALNAVSSLMTRLRGLYTGTTEKGKHAEDAHQATTTQPALLAADAFVTALGAIPADDWCRNWAAGRTIMMRKNDKDSGQDAPACRCQLLDVKKWHSR